jgi:hypothetical protein
MPEPRLRPLSKGFGQIVIQKWALAQTFSVGSLGITASLIASLLEPSAGR